MRRKLIIVAWVLSTVWKAFILYSKQHLIICPPFKDTRWRIDISNSSGFHKCFGGDFEETTSLGWTLLIFPACGKSKENWSLEKYYLEARIPETRGGILNCYCIVFYTVSHGDCSEWLESHLELIWFNSSLWKAGLLKIRTFCTRRHSRYTIFAGSLNCLATVV